MRINALFATSKVHFKRKQKHVYERNVCIITFSREDTPCRGKRSFNNQNFFLQQHYLTAILCIKTISNIANGNSIPICISTKNMQIKSSIIYNVPKISFYYKIRTYLYHYSKLQLISSDFINHIEENHIIHFCIVIQSTCVRIFLPSLTLTME